MLTATEALRRIDAGTLSPLDWIASCRDRIREREPVTRAWAYLDEQAERDAEELLRQGHKAIIPTGAKDIIDIAGMPTGMGTGFHSDQPAPREGGTISLMRQAGCVFLGKTVTTELGHRHPGPTGNPHNPAHTPGGSSSGSAAAVADFMAPICLGTQTTGSVIRPAAYCGIVGYKPSYNDFDKTGVLANAPSMDTIGILSRSVEDAALLRGILVEDRDASLEPLPVGDLTFGLLTSSPWEKADDESRGFIEEFANTLSGQGASVRTLKLDKEMADLLELQRSISGYEFKRSIAFERFRHFDSLSRILREGRLADGERVSAAEYQAALMNLARLKFRMTEIFSEVDIILFPSASGPAPAGLESTGEPTFNSAWSVAGNPVVTLPLFTSAGSGLPIGCQFIAGLGKDDMLLSATASVMSRFAQN
jgi:amidase